MTEFTKLMLRLPTEAKTFVQNEARINGSSQNSEIIRCIRERMEKLQTERMPEMAGKMKSAI
ncbi:Arc family DNA-binding protein [Rhizobium laguerreae]|uniref:Arc family DNA-binding protein n=1 Tax=Rhizobium laguerreae TaxID=1076926 RepID=UPI001C91D356|nr:Arc family DNA-binding protein [Rhizobium laguerreae]MBY3369350.1 Arc family DNA-binding protein [Rhizobium laguerreae]